ncbi:MAG: hypothetical protein ACI38Q_05995 [Candidatus Bruticola sp.]
MFRFISFMKGFFMHHFLKLKKTFRILAVFLCALCCCTILSACSEDDELGNPSRASILVTHEIASGKVAASARALGSDIHSVVYYCYNSQGVRTFGPAQLVKAHQVLLQAVPVESISIGMTYYDSDGNAVAYYSQPVSLKIGEVYEVTNPDWNYLDEIDNLAGLKIAQDSMRVHTGDDTIFYALALFKDAESNVIYPQLFTSMCTWKSSNTEVASLTKKGDDGNESTLGDGKFYTFMAGTSNISASFQGYSDTVPLEVTEASVDSVTFDVEEITLPLGLPSYKCPAIAHWSDGVDSDVSFQSNWTSSNVDRVLASYGSIFPKSCHEEEETATSVVASFTSEDKAHQAICKVTVVDGSFKGLELNVSPEPVCVGETSNVEIGAVFSVNGNTETYILGNSSEYTLTSSQPEVASLDIWRTKLTGHSVGSTVLNVTVDNSYISGEKEITINVEEPVSVEIADSGVDSDVDIIGE